MITVSACLIVKNEAQILARCLECIKKIADEIIIVDTGSDDNTKDIAAEYTDLIYDFVWVDDFSKARNYSFSKATKDYVYVADADEIIDAENIERFLRLKKAMLPEVEIVQMYYTNQLEYNTTYNYDKEYRAKLFKRLREFEWLDPIHETIRMAPNIFNSEISIIHKPLSNHSGRDFKLFQKVLKRYGELSDKLIWMYARELMIAGEKQEFEDAYQYYLSLVNEAQLTGERLKQCQCIVAHAARLLGNEDVFMQMCLKNIAMGKPASEICYELGEYYLEKTNPKEASIWFYNAAYESEAELNLHYSGDWPLNKLSRCYEMLGNQEQKQAYEQLAGEWIENQMRYEQNET